MIYFHAEVRERMKSWKMYSEIQLNKLNGLKKSQVARRLQMDYRTVCKYWDMPPEQYAATVNCASRKKKCDVFESELIEWLKANPDMSAAQCYDWLLEKYGVIEPAERILRKYISYLRYKYDIPKEMRIRQYEALDDSPMGYQAQVDMGQIWLKKSNGRRIQVYCFAMVLSHSRYKFVYWTDRPFTTQIFIDVHNKAFDFFGGRTAEIVYDQDKVLAVAENNGDIIYTEGFQQYIHLMKFKVYLCRGADPETKGRVESVVKYAKYNFAEHRIFHDIGTLNDQCIAWLGRRGNGKEHETTKKIPAEVFALEKQHLIPVSTYERIPATSVPYGVRKDNTVIYKSNRYQVPKGTYQPGLKVNLTINEGTVIITDMESDEIYARHTLSTKRGELVKLTHASRDLNNTLKTVYDKAFRMLLYLDEARVLLEGIQEDKPRYVKDQLGVIINTCEDYPEQQTIRQAIHYCVERKLWSAGDFKQSVIYYNELTTKAERVSPPATAKIPQKYQGNSPKVRDIQEYLATTKTRRMLND